jgi:hypothetical protein
VINEKNDREFAKGDHSMTTLAAENNPSQKPVHASREARVCKGFDCRNKFVPSRKNQVFCSSKCRLSYFGTARKIGTILLEGRKRNPRLRVITDKLLKVLNDLGEIPIGILKRRDV